VKNLASIYKKKNIRFGLAQKLERNILTLAVMVTCPTKKKG